MSTTVDNRIVEMQFNNRDFEKKISTTITSLDKLNSTLKMEGATKGFENLQKAFGRMDLSPVISAAETVNQRFSAMGIMGMEVLERLANKAMDVGNRIADALFVQPPKEGFGEYELEIGSVQTIQASTGEDFDKIYEYLAQLNEYADQTIYSFSDMTSNIGKFTNAGVKLEDAVAAIKGVSNVAALSGANTAEASRAMYNFGQAMGSGAVLLRDWMSVENANMATQEFKNELIETAVAMGTLTEVNGKFQSTTTDATGKVSDLFDATSGFRESLSSTWMTTDVLTATLARYADETTNLGKRAYHAATDVKSFSQLMDTTKEALGTGWADSFRLVIGQFEDAKELWTSVANVIGELIFKIDEFRNHALRFWAANEGRDKMIKALSNVYQGLAKRIEPIQKALYTVFPQLNRTGHILLDFTDRVLQASVAFRDFGGKELSSKARIFERASIVFETLKNVVSSAMLVFRKGSKVIKIFGQSFSDAFDGTSILEVIKSISEGILTFIKNFKIAGERSDLLKRTFDGLFAAVDILLIPIKAVVKAIKPMFSSFSGGEPRILRITAAIGDFIVSLRDAIKEGKGFSGIAKIFKNTFSFLPDLFKTVGTKMSEMFKHINDAFFSKTGIDLSSIAKTIGDKFTKLKDYVTEPVQSFVSYISNTMNDLRSSPTDGVGEFIKNVRNEFSPLESIKDGFETVFSKVKDIFSAFADGLAEPWKKVSSIFSQFSDTIKPLLGNLADNTNIGDTLSKNFSLDNFGENITEILKDGGLAGVIYLLIQLGNAIKSIGDVAKGFDESVIGILDGVRESMEAWQTKLKAEALKTLANAVLEIVGALIVLSFMDPEKIQDSVEIITVMMLDLIGGIAAITKLSGTVNTAAAGTAMLEIATAVTMLLIPLLILSQLNPKTLNSGLTSLVELTGIITGAIAAIALSMSFSKSISGVGGALIGFAVAINTIQIALVALGSMDSDSLSQALSAFGILSSIMSAVIVISSFGGGKLGGVAITMTFLAMALDTVVTGVIALSFVETSGIRNAVKAVTMITILLVALSAALMIATQFSSSKDLILAAVALDLLTVAIIGLTAMMVLLGKSLNEDEMSVAIKGIIAVAGAIALLTVVIGVIASAAGPQIAMAMLAMAASFDMIALGFIGIAVAIGMLVPSIPPLVSGVKTFVKAIAKAKFGDLLKTLGKVVLVLGVLGVIAKIFGVSILVMGAGILAFGAGIWLLSDAMVSLSENGPSVLKFLSEFGKTLRTELTKGLEWLNENIPLIKETLFTAITNLSETLNSALFYVFKGLIDSLIQILGYLTEEDDSGNTVLMKLGEGLLGILLGVLDILASGIEGIAERLYNILAGLIIGVINGITNNAKYFAEAIFDMVIAIIDAVAAMFDDEHVEKFEESAGTLVTNFISAVAKVVTDAYNKIIDIGGDVIGYIVDGVVDGADELKDWFLALPGKILKWIEEVWDEFVDLGGSIVSGINEGLSDGWDEIKETASGVGETVVETVADVFDSHSPSKEAEKLGKFFDLGLADGLEGFGSKVSDSAGNVGTDVLDTFKDSFSKVDASELTKGFNFDFEPSVNPVMDTDDLASGMGDMDNMFSKYQGTAFGGGSIDVAQSASSTITAEISDEQRQMYNKLTEMIAQLQDQLNNVIIVPQDADINITESIDGRTLAEIQAPFLDVVMSERYDDASAGRTQSDQYTGANTYRMLRQPANINPYKK